MTPRGLDEPRRQNTGLGHIKIVTVNCWYAGEWARGVLKYWADEAWEGSCLNIVQTCPEKLTEGAITV